MPRQQAPEFMPLSRALPLPPRPANIFPEGINASKFWRRPNETLVFANTLRNAKVVLDKWQPTISALATDCDLSPNVFKVLGDPLSSRVEVRFLGDEGIAGKRAKQLLDSIKLGGGGYKEQAALSPDNATNHSSSTRRGPPWGGPAEGPRGGGCLPRGAGRG